MRVGILGLQGAVQDHIPHFDRLGAECIIVKNIQSLSRIDRLVIPGGESTVMGKFLREFGMLSPIKASMCTGMPVWGICAGAVLLAHTVDGAPGCLDALPVDITRNAYGRHAQSLKDKIQVPLLDVDAYPAIIIRAPRIDRVHRGTTVMARHFNDPVFVRRDRIMATTFHPELNADDLFHRYFLSL